MSDDDKRHASWWVTLSGRKPFHMGGMLMTHAEALAWAQGIWAKDKVEVEPSIPKPRPQ